MNMTASPLIADKSAVVQKILTAAEQEFAERGFDGAGMKALAARAGVSQSLLHYHFGSKDKLYAAVIQSRSTQINSERLSLLQAVDLTAPDALEQVFAAMFQPALGPSGGGRAYARIFAGLIAGNTRDQELVREHYDETAQSFIAAILRCLDGIDRADAAHIYLGALGVLAMALSRDGRAERLADTSGNTSDDARSASLIRFAVGGAKAVRDA